jgi:microcin C transport system ATP-binding protein
MSVSGRTGSWCQAVKGVSFHRGKGETVALVGESGSGKSVTALSTVGLLGDAAQLSARSRYEGREMVGAPNPSCAGCAATTSASSFRNR